MKPLPWTWLPSVGCCGTSCANSRWRRFGGDLQKVSPILDRTEAAAQFQSNFLVGRLAHQGVLFGCIGPDPQSGILDSKLSAPNPEFGVPFGDAESGAPGLHSRQTAAQPSRHGLVGIGSEQHILRLLPWAVWWVQRNHAQSTSTSFDPENAPLKDFRHLFVGLGTRQSSLLSGPRSELGPEVRHPEQNPLGLNRFAHVLMKPAQRVNREEFTTRFVERPMKMKRNPDRRASGAPPRQIVTIYSLNPVSGLETLTCSLYSRPTKRPSPANL